MRRKAKYEGLDYEHWKQEIFEVGFSLSVGDVELS